MWPAIFCSATENIASFVSLYIYKPKFQSVFFSVYQNMRIGGIYEYSGDG